MLRLKRKITVPIYESDVCDVWLIVADDIHAERMTMQDKFGKPPDKGAYGALLSYNLLGEYAMFFTPKRTGVNEIAHEVFHLTHCILEWTNVNFDSGHHEQGAMLCGYLMAWAMKETEMFRKKRA